MLLGNRNFNTDLTSVENVFAEEMFLESHNVSLQLRRYLNRFFFLADVLYGQNTSKMTEDGFETNPV